VVLWTQSFRSPVATVSSVGAAVSAQLTRVVSVPTRLQPVPGLRATTSSTVIVLPERLIVILLAFALPAVTVTAVVADTAATPVAAANAGTAHPPTVNVAATPTTAALVARMRELLRLPGRHERLGSYDSSRPSSQE
jgi:hypothetical protein